MKLSFLISFFLISIANFAFGQTWRYPHDIFPYGSVGTNQEMKDLKGLKTKQYSIIRDGDTLYAFYGYDSKGRLTKMKDEYSNDTVNYGYNKLNEWEYIFGQNDTIVRRHIEFDSKRKIRQIISIYPNKIDTFKVDRVDDTLIRTYINEKLVEEISHDLKCRITRVVNKNTQTEIQFKYMKDTVSYVVLLNDKVYEYTYGVFKKDRLILIDSKETIEGLNHTREKITYSKKGQILTALRASKDDSGEFNYRLVLTYEYDKKGRRVKEVYYGENGISMESLINYTYY